MTEVPIPPDGGTIERFESATAEHAITAMAPLAYDSRKNRVQLKNLVHDVCSAVADDAGEAAAADLRERLEAAVGRVRPVQRPASFCVLTDGIELDTLLLPEPFPACVMRDTRYYVRPLIQAAATHGEFLLLALSQGAVRLYRLSGEQMTPVEVDGLPGALTDVVGGEVEGSTLQHHVTNRTQFHGQGKGNDDHDAEITRFLRAVDTALVEDPRTRAQYLMIAAVDEMAARFREISGHARLLTETVSLSPDQTAEEDLRLAAGDAFERWRRHDTEAFIESLHEARHGQAETDSGNIVRAAEEGRIDTLLASRDRWLWGRFDREAWSVELHGDRHPGSRDLVDTAMRAAWRQGGQIRIVDDDTPMVSPLEARLRY